jgi:uncharacterized protein (DUF4415 family)
MKEHATTTYSATDLAALRAREGSRSDLARVRDKTEAELERDIAADPDFRDVPADWVETAEALMPAAGKHLLSLRLDSGVVAWFRAQGPGYQTRMNAVLRAFMQAADKRRA